MLTKPSTVVAALFATTVVLFEGVYSIYDAVIEACMKPRESILDLRELASSCLLFFFLSHANTKRSWFFPLFLSLRLRESEFIYDRVAEKFHVPGLLD